MLEQSGDLGNVEYRPEQTDRKVRPAQPEARSSATGNLINRSARGRISSLIDGSDRRNADRGRSLRPQKLSRSKRRLQRDHLPRSARSRAGRDPLDRRAGADRPISPDRDACRSIPSPVRLAGPSRMPTATTPGDRSNETRSFVETLDRRTVARQGHRGPDRIRQAGLRDLRCGLAEDLAALQRAWPAGLEAARAPGDANDATPRARSLGSCAEARRRLSGACSGRLRLPLANWPIAIDLIRLDPQISPSRRD